MKHNFDDCYNEAKVMFVRGEENKYIIFQLAEKGVPDEMIDEVIKKLGKLKKGVKKAQGMKQIIYGSFSIAAAILFSFISFSPGSPVVYVLWGLAITGVLTLIRGIANVIGLL